MRNTTKCVLIGFITGFIVAAVIMFKSCNNTPEHIETIVSDTIRVSDTIVIHDTVHIDKPKPYYVEAVRVDTIAQIDTITVTIPIERKTYQNEDYKAIIEGYKPNLISMDIYKTTTLIRDTVQINNNITKHKPTRWALTIGGGIGYGLKGFEPYAGVNLGYVIWNK